MQPEHIQGDQHPTRSLEQLEAVVRRGLDTFVEVGQALHEIAEGRLYRQAGYSDFGTYCRERFGFGRARGNELIDAAAIVRDMSAIADMSPPQNAWMARALGRIADPDERAAVWRAVNAPDRPPPTGRRIDEVAQQRRRLFDDWPPPEPLEPHAGWSGRERRLWDQLQAGATVVVNFRTDTNLIAAARTAGLLARIDRESDWGNPFELPADGDRLTVVANYQSHDLPFKPSLHRRRHELRGTALACWCAPDRCHGDVLKAWVDGAAEEGPDR